MIMAKKKTYLDIELPKSTDPRLKQITLKMKKENYRPESLIEVLHTAQNAYGYLPMSVLAYITRELKLPPSRVFGTVTFYHFFSLKSKGVHTCLVCTGTACYVKGAQAVLDEVEKNFGLKSGEVSKDNKLGVQSARCIGACGLAPAVVIDEDVISRAKPEDVTRILKEKVGVAK